MKKQELSTKQFVCGVIIMLLVLSIFGFTGSFEWGRITVGEYLLIMLAHFVVMLITACIGGGVITDADDTEKKNRR